MTLTLEWIANQPYSWHILQMLSESSTVCDDRTTVIGQNERVSRVNIVIACGVPFTNEEKCLTERDQLLGAQESREGWDDYVRSSAGS